MKKSLLALMVATALLAGCDDNATTQKLLEAEKNLVQYEANLKTAQTELEKKTAELEQLKADNEKLKAAKSASPALQVEIKKLIDKQETLKFEKDPKEEFDRESSDVAMFVSAPQTNVEWLDKLLLKEIAELDLPEDQKAPNDLTEKALVADFEKHFERMIAEAKEEKPIGLNWSLNSYYLGQRNNVASFDFFVAQYTGGAHGFEFSHYVNIDTEKKAVIRLDDLINKKDQAAVREILWQNYVNSHLNEKGEFDGFVQKKDFRISEDFYFDESGIHFVYPPYELGPYAEGSVEVPLGWYETNFINPAYARSEKDGYYDQAEE